MTKTKHKLILGMAATSLLALSVVPALAQAAPKAVPTDSAYIFNTLLFLICGFLVMWMAAGFAMLEAGMVRTKNVSMQCTKNIALFAIAGIAFWAVGYNVMYDGVDGGFIGSITPKVIPATDKDPGSYAAASDWFFQMVFCATAASIVSGTLAERIKLWPFLVFVVVLCGFIYPSRVPGNGEPAGLLPVPIQAGSRILPVLNSRTLPAPRWCIQPEAGLP